jgi:putative transcriptional regulator
VLPEWRAFAATPAVVFSGGPVSPEAVIALARGGPRATEGWVPIIDDLGTVDLGVDPLDLGVPLDNLRVFVGYAGWAPGQLEGEIDANAWFVVKLARDDPFAPSPERLWRDVLRRQRGEKAMFALFPDDASTN